MAPGWRNRFNKRDRFQKLDDTDVDHDSDDEFGRKEITPFSTTVTSSSNTTTIPPTPIASRSKPVNDPTINLSATPTTNRTVSSHSSPASLDTSSSHSSQDGVHSQKRSTPRSTMELDGFLVAQKPKNSAAAAAAAAAAAIMCPLKHTTTTDDDLVEIYEAEDSSASYQMPCNNGGSTSNNPFCDDDDDDDDHQQASQQQQQTGPEAKARQDNLVSVVSTSTPVDLDEMHDSMDDDLVKSLDQPSVNSHHSEASKDIYAQRRSEEPKEEPVKVQVSNDDVTEDISPVKALVASFNNKATPHSNNGAQTSAVSKPTIVERSKSIPLVPPPPVKPRPVPVPIPTNVPLDSDSGKDHSNNSKDNRSRRSKNSKNSKNSRNNDDATPIEIHGVDLLEERDNTVSELQEMSHLMTFNSLILIQKQKDWLEGSSNKAKSTSLMFELENMERKIKLLSDHREWPNETERRKQQRDPLTPSKAFFKAMSLLDRSIEQFHQGYLSFTAKTSQENHELKRAMEQLQSRNSSLLQETQSAHHTLQHLENERNELMKQIKQMEKHLSLVTIKNDEDMDDAASLVTDVCANNGSFLSKVFHVKAYIESLEEKQRKHLEEIAMLKSKMVVEEKDDDDDEAEEDTDAIKEDEEIAPAASADSGCLDDDLGSRWHTLEANEVATEKAAEKERQVTELCVKLADREQDLASLRSECKLIRMQLLQEERSRNEFKTQMAEKDSALEVANQRIASLEEEVLKTHARCAAFEEDYAALKDSLAAQKEATLQELGSTQEETKAQMEKIRSDYETKLTTLESTLSSERSEKQRLVRDLKTALEEVEAERDQLKANMEVAAARSVANGGGEEKKEPEVEDEKSSDGTKMCKLEEELKQFERMRERLAEKACAQASTIAALTEANENKDAQLTSLQEMIEVLLLEREASDKTAGGQLRQRFSNLRDKMREGAEQAAGMLEMSRHGN
ncbi:hypothetical protein IV203_020689 [Nitzschia inconspicua]|uniref:Uncharacterized protein n=1 Tax=Nitzschia inconspicua TaxID=303405 RepID=A0A9K3PDA9_9STRA|nr:hypothetical protein IV203_020689 [Nitzschia inconspicua]